MSPPSSSVLLVAGSAALLVAAAASYSRLTTTSSTTENGGDKSRELVEFAEEDCIGADEVCKIFDRLFLEMQNVLAQLSQQVQQIQMSGQQIPEAQLRQLLKTEFERALLAKQTQIYDEFDVDEDCIEEATWEFMDQPDEYPKVVSSVERFQKLFENVSGESIVGKRPGQTATDQVGPASAELLDETKLLQAAEAYFGSLTLTMSKIVEQFKEEQKDLTNKAVGQELHMKFAAVANDAGEETLGEMGITLKIFQASVEKYAQNPTVARTLTMLQMKQQQDMMAMGVPAM